MTKIITREGLVQMLIEASPERRMRLIGRALVVLLERQTKEEQRAERVEVNNGIGFTSVDGEAGTSMAKFFQRNGYLSEKQVGVWMKQNKNGIPRIAKYHSQLNESAEQKQQQRQQVIS